MEGEGRWAPIQLYNDDIYVVLLLRSPYLHSKCLNIQTMINWKDRQTVKHSIETDVLSICFHWRRFFKHRENKSFTTPLCFLFYSS
jgi:hypothetical protein